jgi:hypothetical protein
VVRDAHPEPRVAEELDHFVAALSHHRFERTELGSSAVVAEPRAPRGVAQRDGLAAGELIDLEVSRVAREVEAGVPVSPSSASKRPSSTASA